MSVNIKQNGNLTKVANNISIVQANWNDKDNTSKNTCIKNQPETLKTLEEISANTDENALAGANAVKELSSSLSKKQQKIKTMQMSITTGESGDVGIGLYSKDIQIVSVYANTWALVGFYLWNGEWGIRSTSTNTTLSVTILYYEV